MVLLLSGRLHLLLLLPAVLHLHRVDDDPRLLLLLPDRVKLILYSSSVLHPLE